MSYNITNWKTKKLENFKIPLKDLYEQGDFDKSWVPKKPKRLNNDSEFDENWNLKKPIVSDEFVISCGDGQEIIGTIENGMITVKNFSMSGEGSGAFMYYILEKAFEKSTGYLEAVLIWERGDSMKKLIVDNGVVKHEDI